MSRIRVIWKQGQSMYYGQRAIKQLNALANMGYITVPGPATADRPAWKRLTEIEKALRKVRVIDVPCELRIFREPRRVSVKNSRYKTALRTLGMDAPRTPRPPQRTRRRPVAPKQKRASRTVTLLEQEIMRKADDF